MRRCCRLQIFVHLKPRLSKLFNWLQCISLPAFWRQTWRQNTMPDMASGNRSTNLFDVMSGIVFWRHVWRQKAAELCTCNQLPTFGKRAFRYAELGMMKVCFFCYIFWTSWGRPVGLWVSFQPLASSCLGARPPPQRFSRRPRWPSDEGSAAEVVQVIVGTSWVIVFDTFSGVKASKSVPAINCPYSVNEPSDTEILYWNIY